jgi:hypothetical protein
MIMVSRILNKQLCTFLLSPGLAFLLGACGSEGGGSGGEDASVADSGEVADLCTEASPCPLSTGVQRSEFIAPKGDNDDWSFQVGAANSVVNVVVSNDVDFSPVNLELVVFNPSQQSIRNLSFQGTGKQRLEAQFSAPDAGRYIIRVRDVGSDDLDRRNPYFITATSLSQTDENEPNNASSSATALTEDLAESGTIGQQNDQDWFRIVVPANKLLRIEVLSPVESDVQLVWELFQADGITRVAESTEPNGGSWPEQNRATGSAGGTFFIRMTDNPADGADADLAKVYQLTARFLDEPDTNDLAAPNETFEAATSVSSGVAVNGYIASASDQDWYKIVVTAASPASPQLITLEADMPLASPVQLSFTVLGADGSTFVCDERDGPECKALRFQVDGSQAGSAIRTSHFVTAPGTYFVVVRDRQDRNFDTSTPYQVTIRTPADPDAQENYKGNGASGYVDVIADSTSATTIQFPWVQGNIGYAEDYDWYRFDFPGSTETNGGNWNGDWEVRIEFDVDGPTPVEYQVFVDNYGGFGRVCRDFSQSDLYNCQYADSANATSETIGDGDECLSILREATDIGQGYQFIRINDLEFDDFDLSRPYRFRVTLIAGCPFSKCQGQFVNPNTSVDLCQRSCSLPSRTCS